jgi:hypothetical protein
VELRPPTAHVPPVQLAVAGRGRGCPCTSRAPHAQLAMAWGEARLHAAHGSSSGARPRTSHAPPAQFAMAWTELTRMQLVIARMELFHAQLTVELTEHTAHAPPA